MSIEIFHILNIVFIAITVGFLVIKNISLHLKISEINLTFSEVCERFDQLETDIDFHKSEANKLRLKNVHLEAVIHTMSTSTRLPKANNNHQKVSFLDQRSIAARNLETMIEATES